MGGISLVVTVFIVQTVLVIGDSSQYDLLIIPIPKAHQQSIHANKDLIYRHSIPVHHYNAKDRSDLNNILRVKSDDNDYYNDFGDDRIVGGTETEINLYPYHVAYGATCGGVIIDKYWVMTSAHCGTKGYIRYGSKYLTRGKKVNVKASFVHPMYNARLKDHYFDYDFQLLQLEEPIRLGSNAKPIQFAHSKDLAVGKMLTITGWGNIRENGPYSNVLRAARIPIVSKNTCQHVNYQFFRGRLTNRMFCAGDGKKDACQGDSGGPAVVNGRLVGMISFGYGCAIPGTYGVYSKVGLVRDWIKETTGLNLLA